MDALALVLIAGSSLLALFLIGAIAALAIPDRLPEGMMSDE